MGSSSTASTASTASSAASSTTSASAIGASLLTSFGVGIGTNTNTLADEIAAAEYSGQTGAVNSQLSAVGVQISEASQLKSDLLSFSSSLLTLVSSGNLQPSPTVTNSAVATASLPSGSTGATSSYSLEVDHLAQPEVVTTAPTSASSTFQGGTLNFNFGTITNGTFAQDTTQASHSITVAAGASLTDVASAINNGNMGVTAYVATGATGSQLVIKGSDGANSAFTITPSTTDTSSGTSSLASFAFDPASTTNTTTMVQNAGDAQYKLDGVAQTSASNTIANAAPGLSLTLTGTNVGAPTTINYSDPTSSITSAMTNLTSALNSLVTEMNTDMTASSNGSLSNDQGAQMMSTLFSQLPGMTIMPNATGTAPKTLADLGLSIGKDGTFTMDSTKLTSAMTSNMSGVTAMFTDGINGIYGTVFNTVNSLTDSTNPGSLAGSIATYTTQQTNLNTQLTSLNTQQTTAASNLVNQFAAANAAVAANQSTLAYLKNQIAAWNNTTTTSG